MRDTSLARNNEKPVVSLWKPSPRSRLYDFGSRNGLARDFARENCYYARKTGAASRSLTELSRGQRGLAGNTYLRAIYRPRFPLVSPLRFAFVFYSGVTLACGAFSRRAGKFPRRSRVAARRYDGESLKRIELFPNPFIARRVAVA